ncbi:MAG: DUF4169 family protein [Dongiaceae bacterium]
MGDVVNLNRYRKARRARDEKKDAAINRIKFGRNKAELREQEGMRRGAERELDGKAMEPKDQTTTGPKTEK